MTLNPPGSRDEIDALQTLGRACKTAPVAKSILIVDDHPSFVAVARVLLETEGFDVVGVARDGESAVRESVRVAPQFVLLDVTLPDMDGFEVAARLRAAGVSSTIVFTSSRDRADFGSLLTDSGGAGFIAKGELSGDALRVFAA